MRDMPSTSAMSPGPCVVIARFAFLRDETIARILIWRFRTSDAIDAAMLGIARLALFVVPRIYRRGLRCYAGLWFCDWCRHSRASPSGSAPIATGLFFDGL